MNSICGIVLRASRPSTRRDSAGTIAAIGAIIAALGILLSRPGHRGRAKAGLVLNGLVIVVGIVRLGIGGGVV